MDSPTASGSYRPPPTPSLNSIHRCGYHVYAWGRNDMGQLGLSSENSVYVPTKVESMEGRDVVHAAACTFNSMFITDDGEVFTMGANDSGQLGFRSEEGSSTPRRVVALDLHKVVHGECGQGHCLVATDQGLIASWGASEFGQIGQGVEVPQQPQPRIVKGLKDAHFARVAAGSCHSLGLTESGSVYSWGQATFGALGREDADEGSSCSIPQPIGKLWAVGIVQVTCGDNHCGALSADGRVLTWGRGKYGQLGHCVTDNVSTPKVVEALRGLPVTQIAFGGDHSLALLSRGEVYAWGRGSWGATGQGATTHSTVPQLLRALEGSRVLQVSAGARHCVALTSSHEVWTWGSDEMGQLGHGPKQGENGIEQMVALPGRVQGLPPFPIMCVVAGGDHTFVLVRAMPTPNGMSVAIGPSPSRRCGAGMLPITIPHLPSLAEAMRDGEGSREARAESALLKGITSVFTSPGFLVSGFSLPSSDEGEGPEGRQHNLDITAIGSVYQSLLTLYNPNVVSTLAGAALKLMDSLLERASTREASTNTPIEWLRVLLVLALNPLHSEAAGVGGGLVSRWLQVQGALPLERKRLMAMWLARLPVEVFGGRVLRPIQRHISHLVAGHGLRRYRDEVMRAVAFLGLLNDANEDRGDGVPYSEFTNAALSEEVNLREEYIGWIQIHQQPVPPGSPPVSLCQAPWVFTPDAKSRILQGEASIQKQHQVQTSAINAIISGFSPDKVAFLDISVRRSHILADSLSQIVSRPGDLKKPLRVTFINNGVAEEGLDEGGVSREFFQLLVSEIFRPDYGMFTYSEETRTFWFNHMSLESQVEFQLVGIVLGLAIYNNVILDIHFPHVVYKKLLGGKSSLADLRDAFPELGRGLDALLAWEGDDVEQVFCRNFEVEYDFFGERRQHVLTPGGDKTPVTSANRQRYVELYTEWLMDKSIEQQFNAFAHGFHQVCGGPALSLFRHEELELAVCGLPHLDFEALEKGARYEGGYHANHPTITAFWSVIHGLPFEAKRRFLSFTTGCDRAPVSGLGGLTLVVQRSGPDTDRLPTSHTCFNVLLLPEYSSKAKLAERLTTAIENAQGFGLQ